MLARPSFALAISIALVAPRAIEASPITYDFAGTLNQPINGSSQFSGSFTINADPTITDPSMIQESGNDVSLTVHLGGQTLTFGPGSPLGATLTGVPDPEMMPANGMGGFTPGPPQISYLLVGGNRFSNQNSFELSFMGPGADPQVSDLSKLSSSSFTKRVDAVYAAGDQPRQSVVGLLTSIEQVSAPEPSALVVFGAMALGAMALRRKPRG